MLLHQERVLPLTAAAPTKRGHPVQHKPLRGTRVLEIGGYIALPYGSSLLCALGADVVKIEKPGNGDDFRRGANDKSPFFIQYNAGKRSIGVDLKTERGIEVVKSLLPRFDVLLENLRPGKLAALGLGPQECRALHTDLVYGSVNGFGDGGPLHQRPAYDTIGQAFGGLYSLLGPGGSAQLSGTIFADLITGLCTTTGVLAALVGRANTGSGQLVTTSIMEAVSTLTADAMTQYFETGVNPSRESRHPQAQNFCLATASEDSIAVHLSSSQKFWCQLCRAIGREELTEDPRFENYRERETHYFELVPIVEAEFVKRTAQEWEQILTEHDVPFAPVLTMAGYAAHPQVEWLALLGDDHGGVPLLRPPWRFDGIRPDRGGAAPRVGQHTREIAAEVYPPEQIEELLTAGILYAES
jgi:crotonobetainyl-CoA:carnitine CoA-transferase CaiB-like acyl-CoA transferase